MPIYRQSAQAGRLRFVPVALDDALVQPLLAELEARIAVRGYRRVYLTTDDQQPETAERYRVGGYARLPGPGPAFPVAFHKGLA